MDDSYNNSNAVRIIVRTGLNFAESMPSQVEIIYKKLDDIIEYSWPASIVVGNETLGEIYYDLRSTEKFIFGNWKVRAKLTYGDRVLYGAWADIVIGA